MPAPIYTAILHERNHRKELFRGEALNCVASAYDETKIIKMAIDTDTDILRLIKRTESMYAPYLSLTEVVKIVEDTGEIIYTVRSNRFPKLVSHA